MIFTSQGLQESLTVGILEEGYHIFFHLQILLFTNIPQVVSSHAWTLDWVCSGNCVCSVLTIVVWESTFTFNWVTAPWSRYVGVKLLNWWDATFVFLIWQVLWFCSITVAVGVWQLIILICGFFSDKNIMLLLCCHILISSTKKL